MMMMIRSLYKSKSVRSGRYESPTRSFSLASPFLLSFPGQRFLTRPIFPSGYIPGQSKYPRSRISPARARESKSMRGEQRIDDQASPVPLPPIDRE